jgi:3'-phosphoadenosine 5'-phosphosulfate sulfotransferase (PAPS reductase)/FAD synthetase
MIEEVRKGRVGRGRMRLDDVSIGFAELRCAPVLDWTIFEVKEYLRIIDLC